MISSKNPSNEIDELRAALIELKESSSVLEEDLENEIRQLEQDLIRKDQKIVLLEQAIENTSKKAEQAREYATRQQLSIEKQVHAYEASNKRLREDCRRMEQRTETAENACRILQSQYEDLGDHLESALSREAILQTEMDDLEARLKLSHNAATLKLRNEHEMIEMKLQNDLKAMSTQLEILGQQPPSPLSTPHSPLSLDDKHSEVKNAALLFLNKKLREELALANAEIQQAKSRVIQVESSAIIQQPVGPTLPAEPSKNTTFDGMEGYLQKKNEGAITTWKRLLFKINPELHALEFFFIQLTKNTTISTKLGEISLSGAVISEGKADNVFQIQPRFSKKTYVLQAANAEEREKWLANLTRHVAKKLVANSICEDWLKVGTEEDNCQSMYCALLKDSFQYYADPMDLRPVNHIQLVDTILVERTSERPVLGLDYGPGIETQRFFVDCGTDEKHAAWSQEFFQLLGRKRSETRNSMVFTRSTSLSMSGFAGLLDDRLQGRLNQLDSQTQNWEECYFVLSREDSLLKTFPLTSNGEGEPISVLPLLQNQQNGATIAAIITNYPSGAFSNRDHLFGITPPYSNLTRVFQAKTEMDMLQWLDGLVSFLDSKVSRDPYSTEEGYLYKQKQHKRSVDYKKKYVILALPTLKYYKSGSHISGAKTMFLTPESQVMLQPPPKKYAFAFTVRETVESKEVVWTCKNHAEGEKWVANIQAAIVKLRSTARPSIVSMPPPDFLGLTKVNVKTRVQQYNGKNQAETFVLKPKERRVADRSGRLRSSIIETRISEAGSPRSRPSASQSVTPISSPRSSTPTTPTPSSATSPRGSLKKWW